MITACSILFYIWYNGYPIISSHKTELYAATLLGLWTTIHVAWALITDREEFKTTILWKPQNYKIIINGRKSARIFRYFTEMNE